MRRSIVCSFLLSLILSVSSVYAQESAPWPPDPGEIFAPGVEVVSAEEIDLPPPEWAVPPMADDEARIVTAYNPATETLMEYPYPDEVSVLSSDRFYARSDGSIVLNDNFGFAPLPESPPAWILNPATGEFSLAEIVCGNRIKVPPGEGVWVVYLAENALCFTETGELSAPLPPDISLYNSWGTLPQWEDAPWLTLVGYVDGTPPDIRLYSYNVANKEFLLLGTTPLNQMSMAELERNVSETRGTLRVGPPQESLSNDYYTFDVTQPDSLEWIVTGWMYDFYDDPPRYEYIQTTGFIEWKTGSVAQEHIPCSFTLYDEGGVRHFELGYDCIYAEVKRAESGYYYVRADGNPTSTSTLTYLDINTGVTTDIVTGEIEKIESVSPDGRYAALVLDTSGSIDAVDFFADFFYWESLVPSGQLAIFDVVNREYIYNLEAYAGGLISWLADDRVVLQTLRVTQPQIDTGNGRYAPGSIHLLKLDSTPVEVVSIEGVETDSPPILSSPDGQRIIVPVIPDYGMSLIDFTVPSVMPLINDDARQLYDITLRWPSSDKFAVTVGPKAVEGHDSSFMMRYTIAVVDSSS